MKIFFMPSLTIAAVLLTSSAHGIDCSTPVKNKFQDCGWFKSKSIPALEQRTGSAQGFLFEMAHLTNAKLKEVDMSHSTFKGTTISDSRFDNVSFKKNKFVGVRFDNVNFNGSDFSGAIFVRCYFNQVKFQNTNIKPEQFVDPIFVASELPNPLRSEPK